MPRKPNPVWDVHTNVIRLVTTPGQQGSDCHKYEHKALLLIESGSLHDSMLTSTQSDFFVPASQKLKNLKLPEETNIKLSEETSTKRVLREKRSREEKGGLAQKGNAGIVSKQASSDDDCHKYEHKALLLIESGSLHDKMLRQTQSDFFVPASQKLKNLKVPEEINIKLSEETSTKRVLREKRSREEKDGLAQKGIAGIVSKQASSNDDCHKYEHKALLLIESGSLHDSMLRQTQSASQKLKNLKLPEETNIKLSEETSTKRVLREKRSREEKDGLAQKGIAVIVSKQASSNDEFFKPASKRQKEILNATAYGHLSTRTKEEKGPFQFDLCTEAKIAAEENAQHFVGKPTHPFFLQHKGGQRASTFVGLAANDFLPQPASSFDEMDLIPSPPFHITQLGKAGVHTKNLECWTLLRVCRNLKMNSSTFKKESSDQNRKDLDSLLRISLGNKPSKAPRHRRDYTSKRLPHDHDLEPLLTFLKDFHDSSEENLDHEKIDFSLAYLEERLKLFLSHRGKRCSEVTSDMIYVCTDEGRAQKNMLWTDLYQPQSPKEVCGNRDSVNVLHAWLEKWHPGSPFVMGPPERGSARKKISSNEDSDGDHCCFQSESDSEGSTKAASSQNVLFLAGPIGCGKTAAIYACARAHGFTVIEVNSSDNRNGLLIKQKFSESMESHRIGKWSADITGLSSCTLRDNFAATDTSIIESVQHGINQKRRNQRPRRKPMNDLTSTSKLLINKIVSHTDEASASQAEKHDVSKECDKSLTVLLFEDVDMVFEDDRGFIAAVTQLAATAKRPIILTSNDKQLCLPHRLGADFLEFKKPSIKELVVLTYLICIAEGIPCTPEVLVRMVRLCRHDLRLLLNYLQFWFQGHNSECSTELEDMQQSVNLDREVNLQSASASQVVNTAVTSTLFEMAAQHTLWPFCVSLEFPCPVTQSVASQLNKKVFQVESEFDLEEEKMLMHSILEKLALIKNFKKQKIDSLSRTVSNDLNDLTAEESDLLETPVSNLKVAKAVARSPILREKLKKDLATTMFCQAAIEDHSEKRVLKTPRHESGEDNISNTLTGTDVLGAAASNISPSIVEAVQTAALPCEHKVDRAPLSNNVNVDKTELMQNSVSVEEVLDIQSSFKIRCNPEISKLQRVSESIDTLWFDFRHTKEKQGLLLSSTCRDSLETASWLSILSDNLSVCDLMSQVVTEETAFENSFCLSSCYGSLENSNMSQACSMVAHKSLLLFIEQCCPSPKIPETGKTKYLFADMMPATNEPCALGNLITNGNLLPSSRGFNLHDISLLFQDQEFRRDEKKSFLCRTFYEELPSKAQPSIQRASFFENVSFLARIGLLEQERVNSGSSRRRGHGFQNYFRTHPWNLSKESINIIEQFGRRLALAVRVLDQLLFARVSLPLSY
ncbi:hypothetical protein L7F22_013867 [Adiantum nelumboides]|nr:hypothetical protein [Adiantum nelumboides]